MSIYRGSQKIKELRFGGSQKIKEAYVGSKLVYKGGWDAYPVDGIMFTATGNSYVDFTGAVFVTGAGWRINTRSSMVATGIIFGSNTTAFTITLPVATSTTRPMNIYIDNNLIGAAYNRGSTTLAIPSEYIDDAPHEIKITNSNLSDRKSFGAFYFNI